MTHKCIKYRLTEQGAIPDFVFSDSDSLCGLHAVDTKTHSSPQEFLLIGISKKDVIGAFDVISTKEDLVLYLTSVEEIRNSPDTRYESSDSLPAMIPFNATAAADFFWGKLDALNAV
jgi:hypothetical protein